MCSFLPHGPARWASYEPPSFSAGAHGRRARLRHSLAAQALPTSQPALLTIVREDVKIGREADHAKFEAGWPAAYAKAKSPVYYLALVSMTGPNEAWYIVPAASHAQMDDAMKRETGDAALSTELERLGRGIANSSRIAVSSRQRVGPT